MPGLSRAEVEALLAKATPGPWNTEPPDGMQQPRVHAKHCLVACVGNAEIDLAALNRHEDDARLIAAAPTIARDYIATLDTLDAANARIAELERRLSDIDAARIKHAGDNCPCACCEAIRAALRPTQEEPRNG